MLQSKSVTNAGGPLHRRIETLEQQNVEYFNKIQNLTDQLSEIKWQNHELEKINNDLQLKTVQLTTRLVSSHHQFLAMFPMCSVLNAKLLS